MVGNLASVWVFACELRRITSVGPTDSYLHYNIQPSTTHGGVSVLRPIQYGGILLTPFTLFKPGSSPLWALPR